MSNSFSSRDAARTYFEVFAAARKPNTLMMRYVLYFCQSDQFLICVKKASKMRTGNLPADHSNPSKVEVSELFSPYPTSP